MRTPNTAELLDAWEQGLSQPPLGRPLTLLALAHPDATSDVLFEMTIGQRDAELLALREHLFGPHMAGQATCPACEERLELNFSVDDIRAGGTADINGHQTLTLGEYEVCFRLPNSLDLSRLTADRDIDANRRCLFERCVVTARRSGQQTPIDQLPSDVEDAIARRMVEIDPQADVQLALVCPQCDHGWQTPLDIAGFLWTELHSWAIRLLREVHDLASAYGWRETDILALSPRRRQAYLELIGR